MFRRKPIESPNNDRVAITLCIMMERDQVRLLWQPEKSGS